MHRAKLTKAKSGNIFIFITNIVLILDKKKEEEKKQLKYIWQKIPPVWHKNNSTTFITMTSIFQTSTLRGYPSQHHNEYLYLMSPSLTFTKFSWGKNRSFPISQVLTNLTSINSDSCSHIFFPLFFTREQRKLLTIRNWTLLGLHVQNSSIYTYIMTWVYCQLSLEDYSCHVTSRDMSCDQGKFSCEKTD